MVKCIANEIISRMMMMMMVNIKAAIYVTMQIPNKICPANTLFFSVIATHHN